ncbi:MAG: hypothetical protein MUE68_04190 [Bacteroidetes bacterium]|jgi:hypothetical protein|nr:hypothetical protein [Bacteroidota bacterium]
MKALERWFLAPALLLLTLAGCSSDNEVVSAIRGNEELPEGAPVPFLLYQNEPNPFGPWTSIRFTAATTQHFRLRVYTEDWQEAAVLLDGVRQPGNYAISFDGSGFSAGVYYFTLEGGDVVQVRAMRLVR